MLTTFLIEIFLLASVAGAEQSGCSREDARRIRSFLQNEVLPPLGLKPTDLPNSCALHPSLDMYGTHEAHKTSEHRSDWQCMYCRKRFVSENYLDRHLERFHSNLIPTNATTCLGDYSKMFGFQPIEIAKQQADAYGRSDGLYAKIKKSFGTLEKCSETEVLGMTQQCRALSASCFAGLASPVEQRFNNFVCNNLKCEKGVLKGGLHKEDNGDFYVSTVFRILILILLVVFIGVQVFFTNSIYHNMMEMFFNKGKRDQDYLRRYQTNKEKYGWFVVTVVDAFEEAQKLVQRKLKPADKRH